MRDSLGNPNFNYDMACAEICGKGHSHALPRGSDEPDESL